MCLLATVYRQSLECPLLVAANREEFRSRPSEPPKLHSRSGEKPAWIGGTDLRAGGTWLALNEHGLLAAITNRRTAEHSDDARSRGLLCRDLAACRTADEALDEAMRQLQAQPYNGFNLLLLTRRQAFSLEAGEAIESNELKPGVHILTNGALNDPHDKRLWRVRRELDELLSHESLPRTWAAHGKRICSLPAEGSLPAVCFDGGDYGTVSSTVVAVTDPTTESEYHFAAGPPCTTEYTDYSSLASSLLQGCSAKAELGKRNT